jgi:type I restriction enzyme, S subunit
MRIFKKWGLHGTENRQGLPRAASARGLKKSEGFSLISPVTAPNLADKCDAVAPIDVAPGVNLMSAAMRTGYKQTELGVIPEDWKVTCVGDAFEICNGLRLPISQLVRDQMIGDFPYYGPTSVQGWINEHRVEGEYALIGEDGDHFLKWRTQSMTLLVSGKFNVNNHAHLVRGADNQTQWFYWFFANRDITSSLTRQGASRYKLTKASLIRLLCVLPPPAEQRAIASALSDVDALLAKLDQLIAKKRDLKQAAMQQLLTGETRLPGFSGEWEVRRLGDIADCLDNLRLPLNESQRNKMRGDIPYCGANGVLDFVDDYVLDDDVILIAEDGGYFDEFATRPIAYRMSGKCWVNNHAHILKAKTGHDQCLMFYLLVHKDIQSFLASGTRAKLNKSEMNKIELRFATEIEEQTAIATLLSDIDADITALEARRDKTRALKQGMMQVLLSGQIRLI